MLPSLLAPDCRLERQWRDCRSERQWQLWALQLDCRSVLPSLLAPDCRWER